MSKVSIPLEQGNVFRRFERDVEWMKLGSLNPFRTGQCLSTAEGCFSFIFQKVTNRLPKLLQGPKSWVSI